ATRACCQRISSRRRRSSDQSSRGFTKTTLNRRHAKTAERRYDLSELSVLRGSCLMILELTDDQKAFQSTAEKFAREILAQRAAGIDKSGECPSDARTAA